LACINSSNHESNVAELREEVKNLTSEINSKRKEINVISAQEEGVRNNIKYLEEIIAIKVIIYFYTKIVDLRFYFTNRTLFFTLYSF